MTPIEAGLLTLTAALAVITLAVFVVLEVIR